MRNLLVLHNTSQFSYTFCTELSHIFLGICLYLLFHNINNIEILMHFLCLERITIRCAGFIYLFFVNSEHKCTHMLSTLLSVRVNELGKYGRALCQTICEVPPQMDIKHTV